MVFCVSCGHKLVGRYCGQCGGDSQSTADAQSEVPVLAVPAGGAKNLLTHNASKRKGSADASAPKRKGSSAASQRKGSAAGGIGVAQASGQVLENLPAAVASRASPQAASFTETAAVGGNKSGKVHGGPGPGGHLRRLMKRQMQTCEAQGPSQSFSEETSTSLRLRRRESCHGLRGFQRHLLLCIPSHQVLLQSPLLLPRPLLLHRHPPQLLLPAVS